MVKDGYVTVGVKTYSADVVQVSLYKKDGQPYFFLETNDWSIPLASLAEENTYEPAELNGGGQTFVGTAPITFQDEYFLYDGILTNPNDQTTIYLSLKISQHIGSMGTAVVEVRENKAYLDGILGIRSFLLLQDVIENNPEVDTLVLGKIPGSLFDAVNTASGKLLRKAGLNTEVTSTSKVSSGGVDLFAAGVKRHYTRGAELGVHSWCCVGDKAADQISQNSPAHRNQLKYFTFVLGDTGKDFYFYTLQASGFDNIHIMSEEEIKTYNLATEITD
ncbi:hypothetical protein P0082_05680 [Candidatus Haliotispira prima]|uniref:Uncharacterized protein n=1 Tax=Candidatus Haliotispira prima TaxID=3034016 RepID=A0ABY8MKD4_9SPIO|nr:hypothetical protein P0082_05680 [Candidatus Haliotispira prima]